MNTEKNSPETTNTLKKLLLSIKSRISEHRLAIRFALIYRPLNLITIASILPFFLGLYDFMNQNHQLKKILFQKNIPTFGIPTELLNWETFRYFTETKKDFLVGIEKFEWSTNSLFLTKTLNTETLNQEFFIPPNFNNRVESNSITTFLQTFYLNLDEVALKLDNFNSYDMFTRVKNNNSVLNIDEENSSRLQILPFNETFWTKTSNQPIKSRNFKDLLVQSETIAKQIPAVSKFNSNTNTSSNSFLEKQTSWFLEKSLKNCKVYSISLFSKSDDINTIEGLFSELEEVLSELLEYDFSSYRRMSGYSYPDMNSKQVTSFLLHNVLSYFPKTLGLVDTTQNSLKIIFPPNPTFIKQFYFSNPEIPKKFNIKVGMGTLKNWNHNEILYKNISVFVDLTNGLDWKLQNIQKGGDKNLRFWFENYLSPINPLTHSKDTIRKQEFSPREVIMGPSKDVENRLVPFLNQEEWKKIHNENKLSEIFLDDYTINDSSLPTIEISLPDSKYKYARVNFEFNSTVDYLYSPQIFTTKIKPLSSVYGEFFNETFSPIHYKKIMSIFHQPQFREKTFSQSWEPLTFSSWLIVSQIGIAFLFFNFLKYIMSDYFAELIGFIIDLGMATRLFDENIKEQIELVTGKRDKGYRIISKSKKTFQDIAGIKTLLPEIAEIVWFLRNSGKEFSLSKHIPRGLLLIGPPGTGKTVLVQAIAGEAQVPVLTLSGSSLVAPGESGAVKLEFLFQEARQLAPCIVFIDEIDTLAQKRQGVMQNPMGGDEPISALESVKTSLHLPASASNISGVDNTNINMLGQGASQEFITSSETSFFKKRDQIGGPTKNSGEFGISTPMVLKIKEKINSQQKFQRKQLTLLIQLLIELDGIQGRKGVIVIGATNRPELLDPAILRPGRFDKILELGLPSHEKRLEIFKLYGRILGCADPNISWEYFSKRTLGFTPADLASIMNQSCLKAILNDTKHTIQTIEHGINRITTYEIEKPSKKVTTYFLNRVAYYQAGKIVLSTILEHHPSTIVSYLWPRRQNRRSLQILTNLQKYFFQFARRCELEHRIVGCYGGKAAEILFLQNSNVPNSISTFGLEDLSFAFVLICFTIEKWYLYSKSTLMAQLNQILSNKNSKEFLGENIYVFREVAHSMELAPHLLYSKEMDTPTYPLSQNLFSTAWWQLHISQELEFVERHFSDWYRLYLPNPQETELNIEWSPPDEFYHGNLLNKQVNKESSIAWNELHNVVRDYQVHAFVLESFNKALSVLDQNREYLDKLVFELLKKEVLRESEIDKFASSFIPITNPNMRHPHVSINAQRNQKTSVSTIQDTATIKIVNNSFGQMSRRKIKNWIDFKDFEN